jgi:XTP/dITP diphosphohydrolase
MKGKFVFATNNANKLEEIREIVDDKWDILSLKDIGFNDDIPEDQTTLVGNALQKARFIYDKYGLNCFADDTGLEVNALDGAPGVYSARYSGENCTAQDNIQKLLKELENKSDRSAKFITIIALIIDDEEIFFDGTIKGKIADKPFGDGGFGYDPVFIPEGFDDSFAQMPLEIKNRISHRALAMEKLKYFLRNHD